MIPAAEEDPMTVMISSSVTLKALLEVNLVWGMYFCI